MNDVLKPNVYIIGAPKCGTTALSFYLSSHPQVFLCDPKEPFYWCDDFPELAARRGFENLDQYMRLFDKADATVHRAIMEGSTHYLKSTRAIPRINEFQPESKFVAMLRNPVEVVYAYFGQMRLGFQEDQADFESAWRLIGERRKGNQIPDGCYAAYNLFYDEFAFYADALERFFAEVPGERRKVILFDDFKDDPAAVYRDTLRFLELRDDGRVDFPTVLGASENRLSSLHRLMVQPPKPLRPIVNPIRSIVKATFSQEQRLKMRELFRRKKKREPLSPELIAELADHFKDDIVRTGEIIGRDLSAWMTAKSTTPITHAQ